MSDYQWYINNINIQWSTTDSAGVREYLLSDGIPRYTTRTGYITHTGQEGYTSIQQLMGEYYELIAKGYNPYSLPKKCQLNSNIKVI